MFVASSTRTMANARFKFVEPPECIIRSIDDIRAEKRRLELAEKMARATEEQRAIREQRRREILERIESVLKAHKGDRMPREERIPVRQILHTICDFHGVSVAEVMSRRRLRYLCKIRDEAVRAVADSRPDMSLPEIGRMFAGRDHTTILHSLRKTAKPGCDYRGRPLENTSEQA